jgi:hypothetical protein
VDAVLFVQVSFTIDTASISGDFSPWFLHAAVSETSTGLEMTDHGGYAVAICAKTDPVLAL